MKKLVIEILDKFDFKLGKLELNDKENIKFIEIMNNDGTKHRGFEFDDEIEHSFSILSSICRKLREIEGDSEYDK